MDKLTAVDAGHIEEAVATRGYEFYRRRANEALARKANQLIDTDMPHEKVQFERGWIQGVRFMLNLPASMIAEVRQRAHEKPGPVQ